MLLAETRNWEWFRETRAKGAYAAQAGATKHARIIKTRHPSGGDATVVYPIDVPCTPFGTAPIAGRPGGGDFIEDGAPAARAVHVHLALGAVLQNSRSTRAGHANATFTHSIGKATAAHLDGCCETTGAIHGDGRQETRYGGRREGTTSCAIHPKTDRIAPIRDRITVSINEIIVLAA
eukprot:scaffold3352_cov170-Amphora_coffeaeformis.AAC.2